MRWKPKPARDLSEWHAWFAWHPVQFFKTGEFVWLEWVERSVCVLGMCFDVPEVRKYYREHQPNDRA